MSHKAASWGEVTPSGTEVRTEPGEGWVWVGLQGGMWGSGEQYHSISYWSQQKAFGTTGHKLQVTG